MQNEWCIKDQDSIAKGGFNAKTGVSRLEIATLLRQCSDNFSKYEKMFEMWLTKGNDDQLITHGHCRTLLYI